MTIGRPGSSGHARTQPTGWLLSAAHDDPARDWRLWLLTAAATLVVRRTRIHLL